MKCAEFELVGHPRLYPSTKLRTCFESLSTNGSTLGIDSHPRSIIIQLEGLCDGGRWHNCATMA